MYEFDEFQSSEAEKKAAHIKQKSDEARSAFNLPETEPVIQDYGCGLQHRAGRLYLTPNYILFLPSIGSTQLQLPFRKVKVVKKDKNALVFDNSITVESEDGTHFFSSFSHRDEALNLMEYLWKNPVTYQELNDEEDTFTSSRKSASLGKKASEDESPYGSKKNLQEGNGMQQQQVIKAKVDTESTKNALRLANQARDMGTATLVELTVQAEQIDRIEHDVETIHNNLDKSNRILRGIESIGGAMQNAMSKDTTPTVGPFVAKDRTLEIKKKDPPPLEFNILEKLPNDHLQPAIMKLMVDKFTMVDAEKKVTDPNKIWNYDKVEELVVRARHQHLDIKFTGKKDRVRLCSSYLQSIVNEIVLRAKPKNMNVIFEPGVRKFSYGLPELSSAPIVVQRASDGGFVRKAVAPPSVTKKLLKDAPSEVQQQVAEQDNDLDEISNIVGDIHSIANTMNTELDRQNEQLDRVTGRVDSANEKLYQTNKRIDKQLK